MQLKSVKCFTNLKSVECFMLFKSVECSMLLKSVLHILKDHGRFHALNECGEFHAQQKVYKKRCFMAPHGSRHQFYYEYDKTRGRCTIGAKDYYF